jgi:hypothetical protein
MSTDHIERGTVLVAEAWLEQRRQTSTRPWQAVICSSGRRLKPISTPMRVETNAPVAGGVRSRPAQREAHPQRSQRKALPPSWKKLCLPTQACCLGMAPSVKPRWRRHADTAAASAGGQPSAPDGDTPSSAWLRPRHSERRLAVICMDRRRATHSQEWV